LPPNSWQKIEVLTEKAHYNNHIFTDNLGVTAVTKAETVDKISLKSLWKNSAGEGIRTPIYQ